MESSIIDHCRPFLEHLIDDRERADIRVRGEDIRAGADHKQELVADNG